MKLFCFKDHSEPDLKQQLVTKQARLAKYRLLPDSYFTLYPQYPGQRMKHGVDEKPKHIATLEADIAELEVLVKAEDKSEK